MLRQLLGLSPLRRLQPKAPAAADPPPYRRKPAFEALESRLLLSADPVALLAPDGVLTLALTDGDDQAIVERLGASAAGGDIVAVTFGAATQHFGDQLLGVFRLLIDAGAGDDWLRVVGVTVTTDIIGGLGTDTFEWQHGDATWSITALDTGRVETVSFSSFEHLVGADDNQDTFLVAADGAVSGGVDGGAGGFDSLVIQGGSYQSVTYDAAAPDAGTIARDDRTIAYDGIDSVTIGATTAELTLNATAGDDLVRLGAAAAGGQSLLESENGTFSDVTFVNPTAALTISLGAGNDRITIGTLDGGFAAALTVSGDAGRDRIAFDGDVATHGHSLAASAESIDVRAGATVRTDDAGGAAGDIILAAADSSTDARGGAEASVTVTGGTLIGQNIVISANATFSVTATGAGAAAAIVDGDSTATVAIRGASELVAGGTLTIDVSSLVTATAYADPHAAAAVPAAAITVHSTAAARIGGEATLAAGGDVAVAAVNAVDAAAGGSGATAKVTLETTALAEDAAALSGRSVSLRAASSADVAAAFVGFESLTRAGLADRASVTAADAVLVSASAADRLAMNGPASIELARVVSLAFVGADARVAAGSLAVEAAIAGDGKDSALGTRGAFARAAATIDPGADIEEVRGEKATNARAPTSGRSPEPAGRPDGAGALTVVAAPAAGPDRVERRDGASPLELAAAAALLLPAEARPGTGGSAAVVPVAGMMMARDATGRAGALPVVPAAGGDLDVRARQRPAAETMSDRDAGDGDTAVGASLALSLLKDSVLAELARNVSTSGAIVLSAGGTFSARGRAKGAAGGVEDAAGGALEIRDGAAADTAASDASLLDAGLDGREGIEVYAAGSRLAGAGGLVLATAARHDLVAEADGGAERGTGITPVAPIDILSSDAFDEAGAGDTFTLAGRPDAAVEPAASGAADDGGDVLATLDDLGDDALEGLALSLAAHLPPLVFEWAVGDSEFAGVNGAIRVGGGVDALAGERIGSASGVLDLARFRDDAPCSDPRVDGAVAAADENRAAAVEFLAAFAAPIAVSVGLTRDRGRGDARSRGGGNALHEGGRYLPGYGSRARIDGRRGGVRGGSGWVEDFVNDLGLSPEEQHPNAKMRIKA